MFSFLLIILLGFSLAGAACKLKRLWRCALIDSLAAVQVLLARSVLLTLPADQTFNPFHRVPL